MAEFSPRLQMPMDSIQTQKHYMGHGSLRNTERYIKWSPALAEQSARKVKSFDVKELLNKKE